MNYFFHRHRVCRHFLCMLLHVPVVEWLANRLISGTSTQVTAAWTLCCLLIIVIF